MLSERLPQAPVAQHPVPGCESAIYKPVRACLPGLWYPQSHLSHSNLHMGEWILVLPHGRFS